MDHKKELAKRKKTQEEEHSEDVAGCSKKIKAPEEEKLETEAAGSSKYIKTPEEEELETEAAGSSQKIKTPEEEELERVAAAEKAERALTELGNFFHDQPVENIAMTMKKIDSGLKADFIAWSETEYICESKKTSLTEDWFADVSDAPPFDFKEDYLVFLIQKRFSEYATRFEQHLNKFVMGKVGPKIPEKVKTIIHNFTTDIQTHINEKKMEYATVFIDRRKQEGQMRVCDEHGRVRCEGKFEERNIWESEKCKHSHHHVNPYGTSSSLTMFLHSYNLDHSIEINDMAKAAAALLSSLEAPTVNPTDVAELLINPRFLKFVHVKCNSRVTRIYQRQDGTTISEDAQLLSLPSLYSFL